MRKWVLEHNSQKPHQWQMFFKDWNLIKMVAQFYTHKIVSKCINTTTNMALYLEKDMKITAELHLWVTVKWWKEGYLKWIWKFYQIWVSVAYNTYLVELEMWACVLCEFLCNWIQLTAVHYIHLYFLTDKTVQKHRQNLCCAQSFLNHQLCRNNFTFSKHWL